MRDAPLSTSPDSNSGLAPPWGHPLAGVLALVSAVVVASWLVTLGRLPTSWPDSQLYASIARARQLHGNGIPSMLVHSPFATDHLRFYGPVFFDLAATSFDLFGISKWSFRAVSFVGALLFVAASAWLARELNGPGRRWLCSLTLIVLTPEIGTHARSGSMDTLAIAFEAIALVVFVRGSVRERYRLVHGSIAGVMLALAALTTPRTYPFIASFILGGTIAAATASRWRESLAQLGAAVLVLGAIVGAWSTVAHGSPVAWLRYIMFIGAHEDTDVVVLPTAARIWAGSAQTLVTPIVAVSGALLAAGSIVVRRRADSADTSGVVFALVTGWTTCVATALVMNLTFEVGTYMALPLFAIVVALPSRCFLTGRIRVSARTLTCAVAVLFCCGVTMKAVRYVRMAAVWAAANPDPLIAFLVSHDVRGADVVGPFGSYFFVVEQSGGHYLSSSATSWADWARWVPGADPTAVGPAEAWRPATRRLLIWRTADDLPREYLCARGQILGVYVPPAPGVLSRLGRISQGWDRGYPETALYELPPGCPTGYDPTDTRGRQPAAD